MYSALQKTGLGKYVNVPSPPKCMWRIYPLLNLDFTNT